MNLKQRIPIRKMIVGVVVLIAVGLAFVKMLPMPDKLPYAWDPLYETEGIDKTPPDGVVILDDQYHRFRHATSSRP